MKTLAIFAAVGPVRGHVGGVVHQGDLRPPRARGEDGQPLRVPQQGLGPLRKLDGGARSRTRGTPPAHVLDGPLGVCGAPRAASSRPPRLRSARHPSSSVRALLAQEVKGLDWQEEIVPFFASVKFSPESDNVVKCYRELAGFVRRDLVHLDPEYFSTLADGMLCWLECWDKQNPGHTVRAPPPRQGKCCRAAAAKHARPCRRS